MLFKSCCFPSVIQIHCEKLFLYSINSITVQEFKSTSLHISRILGAVWDWTQFFIYTRILICYLCLTVIFITWLEMSSSWSKYEWMMMIRSQRFQWKQRASSEYIVVIGGFLEINQTVAKVHDRSTRIIALLFYYQNNSFFEFYGGFFKVFETPFSNLSMLFDLFL